MGLPNLALRKLLPADCSRMVAICAACTSRMSTRSRSRSAGFDGLPACRPVVPFSQQAADLREDCFVQIGGRIRMISSERQVSAPPQVEAAASTMEMRKPARHAVAAMACNATKRQPGCSSEAPAPSWRLPVQSLPG